MSKLELECPLCRQSVGQKEFLNTKKSSIYKTAADFSDASLNFSTNVVFILICPAMSRLTFHFYISKTSFFVAHAKIFQLGTYLDDFKMSSSLVEMYYVLVCASSLGSLGSEVGSTEER